MTANHALGRSESMGTGASQIRPEVIFPNCSIRRGKMIYLAFAVRRGSSRAKSQQPPRRVTKGVLHKTYWIDATIIDSSKSDDHSSALLRHRGAIDPYLLQSFSKDLT